MADIAAPVYPSYQPGQGGGNALAGDPAKAIGLVGAIQDYQLKNQQFNALSQQPAAALQGQEISNTTAQNSQNEAAAQIVAHHLGTLPDNASRDDFFRMKAAIRAIHPNIPASTINTVADIALREPSGIKNGLSTLRTMGISPESMVSRVDAPPGPGGEATKQPLTSAIRAGTQAVGLAPGESDLNASPAGRAAALQATATTSPQYHADLENLRTDSKILDNLGGPTFEVEKKLNQLSSRLGGFGITMTPDQLKAGESFDKIVNGISLRQGQMFGNTDAGRSMTLGATPNTSMSKFGREGMIDMAQGNQDAVDAARRAWLKARANGATVKDHDLFMDRIGQEMDPRVFQFNRLSRDNQQKFLSQMDHGDIPEFEEKYKKAVANKWVKPLKAPESAK